MNQVELRRLMTEVLRETREGSGTPRAKFQTAFEARIPEFLRARDDAPGLTEMESDMLLENLLASVRERSNGKSTTPVLESPDVRAGRVRFGWQVPLAWAGAMVILLLTSWLIWTMIQPASDPTKMVTEPPPIVQPKAPKPNTEPTPEPPPGPLNETPEGPSVSVERMRPRPPKRIDEKPVAPAPEGVLVGRIDQTIGDVMVRAPGSSRAEIGRPGTELILGTVIETGDMDKAVLRFTDGTVIRMEFNTRLALPEAPNDRSELPRAMPRPDYVDLQIGRIYASVVTLPEQTLFRVLTPAATAEVLGTEFSLNLLKRKRPDQTEAFLAVLDVKSGQVGFKNEFGAVVASDLMRTTALEGSKPTEPVRIRAFPARHFESSFSISSTTTAMLASTALGAMAPQKDWNGLQVDTIEGQIAITKVLANSVAQLAGLKVRDRIVAVNGRATSLHWDLVAAPLKGDRNSIELTVLRDGATLVIELSKSGSSLPPEPDVLSIDQQFGIFLWEVGVTRTRSRAALHELIRKRPHPAYWNNLGLLWQVDDEMGHALRCYRKAISMAPNHPLYRYNYTRGLLSIGNFARADEELEQVLLLAPNWKLPFMSYIDSLTRRNRFEEALAAVEQAERRWPDFVQLHYSKAGIFERLGKIPEALAQYQAYLEFEPGSSAAMGAMAFIFQSQGRTDEAIKAYRAALEFNPQSGIHLNNLGNYLAMLGRVEEAEPLLRKAIKHDPNEPTAYANLGSLLQKSGRVVEAEQIYRKAIEVNPEYETTYNNLGFMLWKLGRNAEAESMLRKALELDPRSPMACANLGSMWADDMGKKSEAVALYRAFLRLNPGTGTILNNLASTLTDLKRDLDEALEAAKGAIAVAPSRPNRHWTLADVYTARKEWDLAEASYRKAIEMYGKSTDAGECWEAMGLMFEKKGDLVSASEALKRALEIDPKVKKAAEALRRIGGT